MGLLGMVQANLSSDAEFITYVHCNIVLVGITRMHQTSCYGETILVLHVPISS